MVVADTDILISAIRDNEIAKSLIKKYCNELAVSAITVAELYVGATNAKKKKAVNDILNDADFVEINKVITHTTIRLIKEYNTATRQLLMPDAFIAATCLEHDARLLTFNTKDFKFIKGLKLAK